MASNPAITIASTIQSASINRAPSPHHDINPSTAASRKIPVRVSWPDSPQSGHSNSYSSPSRANTRRHAHISPQPRKAALPPLPDLRFEQSYLASLKVASGWQAIAWITVKDQIFFPLIQGTLWQLALTGWRHWNRTAQFHGSSIGSRIRRWWWQVNNWELPSAGKDDGSWGVKNGQWSSTALPTAGEVQEFYTGQPGAGGD